MEADDDGVVEAFNVMRSTGFSEDDLRVLVAKGFIKVLNEDLVAFILDWREHNLIRADRKIDSIYKDLLLQMIPEAEILRPVPRADTKMLAGGRPVDNQRTAQVRLGKVRLGKDKEIAETSSAPKFLMIKEIEKLEENKRRDLNIVALYFREKKLSFENKQQLNAAIRRHLRAAKQLTPFSDKQIVNAATQAQSQYPGLWTIETLLKIVTR
jgi:hypothetical protein